MVESANGGNELDLHLIVDFMYLYYKYKFTIDSGRINKLEITDKGEKIDVSYMYYPLREIEGFRRRFEKYGYNVTMSVCFDSPSNKKDINSGYKSSRVKRLREKDFETIEVIRNTLDNAGYNVYKLEGIEADDIINSLTNRYKNMFAYNIIYTPDTDLFACIKDNVGVYRYRTRGGYQAIEQKNFEESCTKQFKCKVPYNAIILYKALCGDRSDDIKGVRGFGPAAFNKFVRHLGNSVSWPQMTNVEYLTSVLEDNVEYLGVDAIEQAEECLRLVAFQGIAEDDLEAPVKVPNTEDRELAYRRYGMESLIA